MIAVVKLVNSNVKEDNTTQKNRNKFELSIIRQFKNSYPNFHWDEFLDLSITYKIEIMEKIKEKVLSEKDKKKIENLLYYYRCKSEYEEDDEKEETKSNNSFYDNIKTIMKKVEELRNDNDIDKYNVNYLDSIEVFCKLLLASRNKI